MSGSIARDAALVVFAKAPIAGRVKTRLAPALGEWGAARLHGRLAQHALATAIAARAGVVELHADRPGHGFIRRLRRQCRVPVKRQKGRDLGERMRFACAQALRTHRFVVLIGSDCPALRPADLRRALRLLRAGADVVLGPAEDGGYVLIGLRRFHAGLFTGIAWGGASVGAQTLRNASRAGLAVRRLRTLWDLDLPQDLPRLAELKWLRFRAALPRCVPR